MDSSCPICGQQGVPIVYAVGIGECCGDCLEEVEPDDWDDEDNEWEDDDA